MRINHNIQALNAYRNLGNTNNATSKSLEKLSSGLRINRAADDAAGLAISEKMRSQIRGLDMAERNSLDAISLIQTAEGALASSHDIVQRMRELAVQASNGTLEDSDREAIQNEINALTEEIDRIADTTQFNRKVLFSGKKEAFAQGDFGEGSLSKTLSTGDTFKLTFNEVPNENDTTTIGDQEYTFVKDSTAVSPNINIEGKTAEEVAAALATAVGSGVAVSGRALTITAPSDGYAVSLTDNNYEELQSLKLTFQIGANEGESLEIQLKRMDAQALGLAVGLDSKGNAIAGIDISTAANAQAAVSIFDKAIGDISLERSRLGAVQNRLDHTITNLQTANENLTASESRIRDLDMAKEMTQFTRNNILNQAGQAMLAQANQLPQGILQLLQ